MLRSCPSAQRQEVEVPCQTCSFLCVTVPSLLVVTWHACSCHSFMACCLSVHVQIPDSVRLWTAAAALETDKVSQLRVLKKVGSSSSSIMCGVGPPDHCPHQGLLRSGFWASLLALGPGIYPPFDVPPDHADLVPLYPYLTFPVHPSGPRAYPLLGVPLEGSHRAGGRG